jgi:hypothetical protein
MLPGLTTLLVADWNADAKWLLAWAIPLLVIEAVPLALLYCCWRIGDVSVLTKILVTVLYLAHFPLLFIPTISWTYLLAQPINVAVLGVAAFGWGFLRRRRWWEEPKELGGRLRHHGDPAHPRKHGDGHHPGLHEG